MKIVVIVTMLVFLAACSNENQKSVVVLVDVSLTYFDQVPQAKQGVKHMLAGAQAEDFFMVAAIGDRSFTQEAIAGQIDMAFKPSARRGQILKFAHEIDNSDKLSIGHRNTDIRGAILLAVQEAELRPRSRKYLVIFSDLDEDPASDLAQRPVPDLAGYTVVLANVKRLAKDNRDPAVFTRRIDSWKQWLTSAGAEHVVVSDIRSLSEKVN